MLLGVIARVSVSMSGFVLMQGTFAQLLPSKLVALETTFSK